ncbi:unnamed protein product [Prorocentrum cordatum]|uniref:Uncharacterized protein n=1 Tax=Prorocentrum cordatum TaxID=2364126 RepID=A0ABN9Y574_9DINO|nr:unnamed protein product [Polarella glacialis]
MASRLDEGMVQAQAAAVVADDKKKPKPTGPCAKEGENCLDSQCCAAPGMQCYAEQQYWARLASPSHSLAAEAPASSSRGR